MNPLVSVIIPLYNHERYITKAIESILNQSFSNFEIIIINDGSTDQSEEKVKLIKDTRILYSSQENQGASYTLNKGIKLARGKYISILNSDDSYFENRLEKCIDSIESTSNMAVFTGIELINDDNQSLGSKLGQDWNSRLGEPNFQNNHSIILDLLAGNFLHTTSNLFCKKEVFFEIGFFKNLRYTHDYEFFLRLCVGYPVLIIKENLLYYRFHSSNTLGDDFARSNFETGLILANFLLENDLSAWFHPKDSVYENLAKFHNSLNSYGTDRLILTLFLFSKKYALSEWHFFEELCGDNNPLRAACIQQQRLNREQLQLQHDLQWQTNQTEHWWRKNSELIETLKWQKSETSRWWSSAEDYKKAFEWQKQQTDYWWQEQQQLKKDYTDKVFELNSQINDLNHNINQIKKSLRWRLACKAASFLNRILLPIHFIKQRLGRTVSRY